MCTSAPKMINRRTRWDPMNPDAPVTNARTPVQGRGLCAIEANTDRHHPFLVCGSPRKYLNLDFDRRSTVNRLHSVISSYSDLCYYDSGNSGTIRATPADLEGSQIQSGSSSLLALKPKQRQRPIPAAAFYVDINTRLSSLALDLAKDRIQPAQTEHLLALRGSHRILASGAPHDVPLDAGRGVRPSDKRALESGM